MNLLDLMVKVGIDDQASQKIGGIASRVSNGLSTAGKVGALAMTSAVAGVTALTGALTAGVAEVAQYGDSIDKMSQKMGLSAQSYQEWDSVLRHSGTSIESMKMSMKTLANAVESGNEAFQRIGLTQEQLAGMSQEQIFEATIAGLQNVEDTTERTYLAGQLLGRGATELGALLNTSAEDTQKMRDRVHELGGVMSDEAVKSAAAFQDSLQDMQTAMAGVKRGMLNGFLPAITTIMNGMQDIISGYDAEGGLNKIQEGIGKAIEMASNVLPDALAAGGEIMSAIVQGLLIALPQLITNFAQGIVELINTLSNNTETMLDTAGQLFMAIATALIEALPSILASLVTLLMTLIQYVINHAPQMLSAAGQLILGLIQGIGQGLSPAVDAIGEVINGVIGSIGGFFDSMLQAGKNIVMGFVEGIKAGFDSAVGAVKDGLEVVRSFLPFSPAKQGPFSGRGWTLYSGQSLMYGLADGIRQASGAAQSAMLDATKDLSANAEIGVSPQSTDLLNGINGLSASMGNLGIYLDGKVLVGYLTPTIDRALVVA